MAEDSSIAAVSWEQALIGTVLGEPGAYGQVQDMRMDDFTGTHQDIWVAITSTAIEAMIDKRAVIERMRTDRTLQAVGSEFNEGTAGEEYFATLLSRRGEDIHRYRTYIEEASVRRSLRLAGGMVMALANEDTVPSEELIEDAIQRIINVRRGRMETGASIKEILDAYTLRVDGIRAGTWVPAWTPALEGLQNLLGFIEPKEYITVAARPGEGKSSYLRYEALSLGKEGKGVAIFNLENDEMEYAKGLIALVTGINSRRLKEGLDLTEQELANIRTASDYLATLPIQIITLGGPSVRKIASIARQLIATDKISVVMVDYVQLIRNGIENKVQDVSETTTSLRALAMETATPIIQAAQLNRAIETRNGEAEPQLSDLRDSGSLEQDSTQVWFPRAVWKAPTDEQLAMFRQNKTDAGALLKPTPCIPIRFYVRKNRNGPTGVTSPVLWNRATNDFTTLRAGSV